MNNTLSDKHKRRLLVYSNKNEMFPSFLSGIFLSGAINIMTTDESRSNAVHLIAMTLMFLSSLLYYFLASKTHELQAGFSSIEKDSQNEEIFFGLSAWNFRGKEHFFERILLWLPSVALIIGVMSFLIYFWGEAFGRLLCKLITCFEMRLAS